MTSLVVLGTAITAASAQNIDADYQRGVAALKANNHEEAFTAFDGIIKGLGDNVTKLYGPMFGAIYFHRGLANQGLKRYADAAVDFETSFQDFANRKEVEKNNMYETMSIYSAAVNRRAAGDFETAIKHFHMFEDRVKQDVVDKPTIRFNRADLMAHKALCYARTEKPRDAADLLVKLFKDKGLINIENKSFFKPNVELVEEALVFTLQGFVEQEDAASGVKFIQDNRLYINRDPGLRYKFAKLLIKVGAEAIRDGEHGYALAVFSIIPKTRLVLQWVEEESKSHLALSKPNGSKSAYGLQLSKIREAVEADVNSGQAIEVLILESVGAIYELNHDFEGSYAVYNYLAENYPKAKRRPYVLFRACNAAYITGRVLKCEEYGKIFLDNYPDHELRPNVETMMIQGIFFNGDYDKALQVATSLRPKIPDGSSGAEIADYVIGASNYFLGNWNDANSGLAKHIEAFPDSAYRESARYYQADTLVRLGDFGNAAILLDKYLDDYPDGDLLDRALYTRATIHYQRDELTEAQSRLNEFFSKRPNSTIRDQAFNLFGNVLEGLEEPNIEEAEKAYQRALLAAEDFQHDPVAAESLQYLTTLEKERKDYVASAKHYDTYFEKYPSEFNRAKVAVIGIKPLEETGRLDDALERIEKFIAEFGNTPDAFGVDDLITAYAETAINGGMTLEELQQKGLNPPNLKADSKVARAMWQMAVIDAYEKEIEKSDESTPRQRQLIGTVDQLYKQLIANFEAPRLSNYILYRLGDQLLKRERSDESENYFSEILKRDDTSYREEALFAMATLKSKRNDPEAIKILNELIANYPNDNKLQERAVSQLADSLMNANKWQEANTMWRDYLKKFGTGSRTTEATYKVGLSHEKMDQPGDALAAYTQVFGVDPGFLEYSVPAWLNSAKIYWAAGEKQNAYDTLHIMLKKIGHLEAEDPSGGITEAREKLDLWGSDSSVLAKPLKEKEDK